MLDFGKAKMTHERIGKSLFMVKVGGDRIKMSAYIDEWGYRRYKVCEHYIMHPGNTPQNPNRTKVLRSYAEEYLDNLYHCNIEKDIREIAQFPILEYLKEDYEGIELRICEYTTPKEVIDTFERAYKARVTVYENHLYDILQELSQIQNSFLSKALKEWFDF